jgi:8-oxo-dGTP pyrophosphatase MutT (NUDIX family)
MKVASSLPEEQYASNLPQAVEQFILISSRSITKGTLMHRSSFINLLRAYHPSDAAEQAFVRDTIAFVEQHPDCFDRSQTSGHITGSAWLLHKDMTKALLMHHTKLDRWFQLGGHCDGDADVLAVAVKEAQEESGIQTIVPVSTDIFDVDVHLIPENKGLPAHYHYDIRFLLRVASDEDVVQNRESKELRWIGKNTAELPTNAASVTRMFHKWLALKN